MKLLLIEDDRKIATAIKRGLQAEGFTVEVAERGDDGYWLATEGSYDLIILDILLPGHNGYRVCADLRTAGDWTPILMLTAKAGDLDEAEGLDTGADDYLTKPFSLMELLARVKALLRRTDAMSGVAESRKLIFKDLHIDTGRREVVRDGKLLELTPKEFDLLLYFASHPGEVFSRMQLLEQVWGYNHEGYEHTVNSHINRLRGKLEPDPAKPSYIKTAWGVGYQFTAEPP